MELAEELCRYGDSKDNSSKYLLFFIEICPSVAKKYALVFSSSVWDTNIGSYVRISSW